MLGKILSFAHLFFLPHPSFVCLIFSSLSEVKNSKTLALFAAFLPALSELQLVHFILRWVSNKINRSVSWEIQGSGSSKIRKEEAASTRDRKRTKKTEGIGAVGGA